MLFTVLSYVVAAVHVLLPPYLLYQLWCTRFRTVGAWLIEAGFTAAALAVLYLFGWWDMVGVPLRYGIGAAGASSLHVRHRGHYAGGGRIGTATVPGDAWADTAVA